jgi:ankyrin repeat protein
MKLTMPAFIPLAVLLSGTAPAAVDYARDIQPLFERHCYECHGPKKQKNGFRLDRKSRAFRGMMRHNIIPGSSSTSRVYRRVVDGQSGLQMPPEDALSTEQIELIRQWIDEGAHWPDELANEVDAPPADPRALALIALIRDQRVGGDRRAVLDAIAREPQLLDARGPEGSTPLMFVALYGDRELLRTALAAGGNPNHANDGGATALMWAADDADKVRVLLEGGANPNVDSVFGRTPLWIASTALNASSVDTLLAHGATPSPQALNAAAFGSETILRRLIAAGAKDKGESAGMAIRQGCLSCVDAYPPEQRNKLTRSLLMLVPPAGPGNPVLVRAALAHGADPKVRDLKGRTVLIALAISELSTPDLMQEIIDRGVELDVTGADGMTALDHAIRAGRQPIIDVLKRNGARKTLTSVPAPRFVANNSPRAAVERVLPMLQASSKQFYDRGGCVGCHHNLQMALTVQEARRTGIQVDEILAAEERATMARDIDIWREQSLQGIVAPGGAATTTGYLLMALDAQGHPADTATDTQARLLRMLQRDDGRWLTPVRPPIEYSEFTATAVSVRGLSLYGGDDPAASKASIERAVRWLEGATPRNHEDRVFRLLGLSWAGTPKKAREAALRELQKQQRSDGGWAQTDFRASDAYATGEALYALRTAGVSTGSRTYRRGVKYLLSTQLEDGSWLVRSRSLPTQAYFESGFPHGGDQFISSAATHWAVLALLQTLPDSRLPPRSVAGRQAGISPRTR